MGRRLYISFFTICYLQHLAYGDKNCDPPKISNGEVVEVSYNENKFVGMASCDPAYTLVGQRLIKCMNGIWSAETPICTSLDGCDISTVPNITNGRKRPLKLYRGSVVRYSCFRGYKLFGKRRIFCDGYGKWNLNRPPVCVRKGCDEDEVRTIQFGQSKRLLNGEVYMFKCDEGSKLLSGSKTIFCDGKDWNDTAPICLKAPSRPELTMKLSGLRAYEIKSGDKNLTIECTGTLGNPSPRLTMYKDGDLIAETTNSSMSYHIEELNSSHDQSVFVCSASNEYSVRFGNDESTVARMTLNVSGGSKWISIRSDLPISDNRILLREENASIRLECISDESKPITDLTWASEDPGSVIRVEDTTYPSSVANWFVSMSVLLLNSSFEGLTNKVKCSGKGVEDEVTLVRIFPPKSVKIVGERKLPNNGSIRLKCQSGSSNPPPKIRWEIEDGIHYDITVSENESTLILGPLYDSYEKRRLRYILIQCIVSSPLLEKGSLTERANVTILHLPDTPVITGFETPAVVGVPRKYVCSSRFFGNPSVTFEWLMNDERVEHSFYETSPDGNVTTVFELVPRPKNNGSELKCLAVWSEKNVIYDSGRISVVNRSTNAESTTKMTNTVPILTTSITTEFELNVSSAEPLKDTMFNDYTNTFLQENITTKELRHNEEESRNEFISTEISPLTDLSYAQGGANSNTFPLILYTLFLMALHLILTA